MLDAAWVEKVLRAAVSCGASDVHMKAGEPVLLRVRGELRAVKTPILTPEHTRQIFQSLHPGSQPDATTELDFSHAVAGLGRFRVNAFRQRGSMALVVRVIPLEVPKLKDLNLPERLPSLASEQRGLVIVTGTTGSGKSTTLAAMLDHINHARRAHVITIEDPIEFFFKNDRSSIIQREVGSDTPSFAVALRAALRQDPDVLMIGEMRDTETIDIALKAAETGHLVLSTAHTTDAIRTVQRILSVFPASDQPMLRVRLSETLRGVICQRLLPRSDGLGLIPAVELMVATPALQDAIRNPERTHRIRELVSKGRHYGMQSFDQSLLKLVNRGMIAWEVALGAASSPGDLDLQRRMGATGDEQFVIDEHLRDEDKELPLAMPYAASSVEEPVHETAEALPDDEPLRLGDAPDS